MICDTITTYRIQPDPVTGHGGQLDVCRLAGRLLSTNESQFQDGKPL
jgi:hypothetical protein